MKTELICVDRIKDSDFRQAAQKYITRITPFSEFCVSEIKAARLSQNPSEKEIKKALELEGREIKKHIPKNSFTFALCVEGQELSSEDFAKKIKSVTEFNSRIAFIIGSSYGLSNEVKNNCDFKLSLGRITLPHELARVVLCEQIYRAFSILNGSKYHK